MENLFLVDELTRAVRTMIMLVARHAHTLCYCACVFGGLGAHTGARDISAMVAFFYSPIPIFKFLL